MAIDITKVLNVIQEKIGSANTSVSTEDLFYLTKAAKAAGSGSVIESYANSDVFPTANNTVKKLAFDELNRTLYMNSDGTWAALDITVPDAAAGPSSGSFQGSNYGYATGGSPSATPNIDKFPFASDTDGGTSVGSLAAIAYWTSSQSSAEYGYVASGFYTPPNAYLSDIEKFPFATDTNASKIGDVVVLRTKAVGQSSISYGNGYVSGGRQPGLPTPSPFNQIEKFPFASDADAADVGDLTVARGWGAGQSSSDYGYVSGGYSPTTTVIDKFPFASDGNATDVGDLTLGRYNIAGQSSTDNGYASGGYVFPSAVDTIEKFPFASDANATDIGNLSTIRQGPAGISSTDYGYAAGGTPGTNTLDRFPFSSDADATDIANMAIAKSTRVGHQY
jgi:hypothetical protein